MRQIIMKDLSKSAACLPRDHLCNCSTMLAGLTNH